MHQSLAARIWYQSVRLTLRAFGAFYFRLRYSGEENIPQQGPVLICANHQSHLDPPLVGLGSRRIMNFMARETLFHSRLFGWFIDSINAFPIDLEGASLSGIKQALKLLKGGETVVIFPEGTRSRDGEIGPFRPGVATLALRAKATILPVAIEGAYDAYPRGRKLPRPGIVHVLYGKPILPEEAASLGEEGLLAELERRIRQQQAELRSRPVFAGRKR